jgi:hypothetical protein
MPNRIVLKKGTTAGTAPIAADLEPGELAINTADGALFTKLENGTVYTIVPSSTSALAVLRGGTGVTTAPSLRQLLVGQSNGTYALRTLAAGSNITITETSGSLTISSSGGGGGGGPALTASTEPPEDPETNAEWLDTTTGARTIRYADAWVEF